jgi:rhamnosyltransferase
VSASIVIRARDKERELARTLEILATQTVRDAELIVVDSGSRDGTVRVAREAGAQVIEIPPESFTYGGALNTGAAAAGGEIIVALSAHSHPFDDRWLERMLDAMADASVACASGQMLGPDGEPLSGALTIDAALARRHPFYGYSNHAGAFRASLWRERPFRSDMPYSEDREWAWHWLHHGHTVVIDPALRVEHSHGMAPMREQYRRAYLMWIGYGMYCAVEPPSVRALVAQWWHEQEGFPSQLRARMSRRRAARLAGAFAGRRAAARR